MGALPAPVHLQLDGCFLSEEASEVGEALLDLIESSFQIDNLSTLLEGGGLLLDRLDRNESVELQAHKPVHHFLERDSAQLHFR